MKKKPKKKLEKSKLIICIVYYAILLFFTIFDSIKMSYVYIFPLVFEIITNVLIYNKCEDKYLVGLLEIIKALILLLTLIVGFISFYTSINEIFIKILLTITIAFEMLATFKKSLFKKSDSK